MKIVGYKLTSLYFNKKKVGVRVDLLTDEGTKLYDVDAKVWEREVALKHRGMPKEELVDINGNLVTKAELANPNLKIADMSDNIPLLHKVRDVVSEVLKSKTKKDSSGYIMAYNEQDWEKYKFKVKSDYWYLIPSSMMKDFVDFYLVRLEGNAGIYDDFSDKQHELIMKFFKQVTRDMFKQLVNINTLKVGLNKSKEIYDLMGNAEDWEYNGCVDTGYYGGDCCALGHPLRYRHSAISRSTGVEIPFGSSCISDFFNVDISVVKKLNKVQEEALKEIKAIAYVYAKDKQEEYKDSYYPDIDLVMGVFNKDDFKYYNLMNAFLKLNLPLPQTLISIYSRMVRHDNIRKEKMRLNALEVKKQKESIAKTCSVSEEVIDKLSISGYADTDFGIVCQEMYRLEKTDSVAFKDMVALLPYLAKIKAELISKLGMTVYGKKITAQKLSKSVPMVNRDSEKVLATIDELADRNVEKFFEVPLSEDFKSFMYYVYEFLYRRKVHMFDIDISDEGYYITKYNKFKDSFYKFKKYYDDGNFTKHLNNYIKIVETFNTYKTEEEPINDNEVLTPEQKLDFLMGYQNEMTEEELNFWKSAMTSQDEYEKHKYALEDVYARVMQSKGKNVERPTFEQLASDKQPTFPIIEEVISKIEDNADKKGLGRGAFAFNIIATVNKYKKASEKQYKYIYAEYLKIEK